MTKTGLEKVVNLFFLLIIIIIVAVLVTMYFWPALQAHLNWGNQTYSSEEASSYIEAENKFYEINKVYGDCLNSDKYDCLCSKKPLTSLAIDKGLELRNVGASKTYLLLNQLNKKGEVDSELNKTEIDGFFNCFIKYDKDRKYDIINRFSNIKFLFNDKNQIKIIKGSDKDYLKRGYPSLYKPNKNSICLLGEDFYYGGSSAWYNPGGWMGRWQSNELDAFVKDIQEKPLCE